MDFVDWCFNHGVPGVFLFLVVIIAVCGAAVMTVIAPFIWWDSQQPSFSLKKAEWGCTMSHTEMISSGYMDGKVWIPTVSEETICDQWSRRG